MQVLTMSEIVTNEQRAIPGVLVMAMFGVACVVYAAVLVSSVPKATQNARAFFQRRLELT